MSKYIGDVSAYAYAVSKGYIGTEEEFAELMAAYADVGQTAVDAKDAAIVAKTAAETAASTATSKASEATIAAQTASTKAGEAQTSAQTASSKTSEASQSASQAESARDTAQTYANNAQASATSASQSATASANSATASAQSASQSAQIKTDVEDLADDAQASASASAQSASASANSASQASGYAQSASASAQSASGYASQAQTSAQTASNKASEASQSASQASGYAQTAETAKTDAQTAKTQAESARDSAITAKTAAETAQGKAEDAQAAAESVAESIPSDYSQLSEDVSDLKSEITALESDGVAPSAEQLLSKNTTADAVPYLFRQTGGNGADREYLDAVVGGTVCWNQLVNEYRTDSTNTNGLTFVKDADNKSISISGTITTAFTYDTITFTKNSPVKIKRDGRKYIIICNQATPYPIRIAGFIDCVSAGSYGGVFSDYVSGNQDFTNMLAFHAIEGDTFAVSNFIVQMFDLTTMFGAEIADYIYSLERTTAGAGVALFRQMFPEDYYDYNAGELKSVEGVSAHETVGFNQWDEEWEVGGLNPNSGGSKNYIPVVSGATYYFCDKSNALIFVHYYDAQKQWIGSNDGLNGGTLTLPDNCSYIRFRMQTTYGTTYNHDICINISDPARNGEYEPYVKRSYPLDSTLTLRGIPKLSDGKMYFDGDRYLPDGTVERRYGIVDLGTQNWRYQSAQNRFYAQFSANAVFSTNDVVLSNIICSAYRNISFRTLSNGSDNNVISAIKTTDNYVSIRDTAYADVATFKTAMSGVYLVYPLATPTTEQADPYLHLQQCDPNGTEEFVSTGIVPVGHETRYPENLRAKIEGLPWDFSSLIAPTEKTTTASRNYTTGNLLIMGNTLYKVTANIAKGGTITPNTNVTATTLSEILSALKADYMTLLE